MTATHSSAKGTRVEGEAIDVLGEQSWDAMRAPVSGSATLRELPGVIAFRPIKAPAADRAIVGPIGAGVRRARRTGDLYETEHDDHDGTDGACLAPATSRRPRTCSRSTRTTCATIWRLAYSANGSASRPS